MATGLGLGKKPPEINRFVVLFNIYAVVNNHSLPNKSGEAALFHAIYTESENINRKETEIKIKLSCIKVVYANIQEQNTAIFFAHS